MKNTKQRKELAHAFRVAQEHLGKCASDYTNHNKPPYICYAIDSAYLSDQISFPVSNHAKGIVTDRLGDNETYIGWLRSKGDQWNRSVDHDTFDNNSRKIQAGRLAWLKDLEREFSEPS